MKLAIGMIVIAAGVSGCSSSGLPALGLVQSYAYPSTRATVPVVRTAAPVVREPASPVAATPVPAVPPAGPAAENLPVYDETKDPYVTAVLLPPVGNDDSEDKIGPDGRLIVLAKPATIEVIDVSDSGAALAAANP